MSEELITDISEEDKKRLEMGGIELNESNRSGSFIQTDQHIHHSESKIEGIEMLPIDIALKKYDWLHEKFWNLVKRDKDEYTRFVAQREEEEGPRGFVVIARKGSKNIFPLQSCLFMQKSEIQTVHNIIIAEEGAELHLITGCTSSIGRKEGTHYGITETYVGKNALVSNTMIHTWGENIRVLPRSATRVEDNATFLSNYISMNPVGYVQMYPVADLVGKNAVARFNSVVIAHEGSELDMGQRALLNGEGASAELTSRIITTGGKAIARSHILGNAPEAKGHIECKALILRDGTIHSIPEIEGRLTNIEISHEAAVGKIARDEIEYLMARGLSEEEATATIIRGFLDVRINGLPDSLQKRIDAVINAAESGF